MPQDHPTNTLTIESKPTILSKYGLIFAISLGLILRLIHAGARSLRFEEGLTAQIVKEDFLGVIRGSTQNSTPIVFNLLVHYFVKLFGSSEFVLTLVSIFAGIGLILVVYLLGRRYFSKKVGLIAALFTAISPYLIYYSQEVRPYALLNFFALGSAYVFLRALETNQFKYWASVLLLNILAVYTQSLGWLVVISEAIYFVIYFRRYKRSLVGWIVTNVMAGLYYLPQQYFNKMLATKMGWQFRPAVSPLDFPEFAIFLVKRFLATIMHYSSGYYYFYLSESDTVNVLKDPTKAPIFILMLFIPLVLFISAFFLWKRDWKREYLYLFLIFIIPFVLIWMEGTSPKYYTMAAAPFMLICALGFFQLSHKFRIGLAAGLIITTAISLGDIYSLATSSFSPENPRDLSRFVAQHKLPTDIVLVVGGLNGCHTWRYYNPEGVIYGNPYWSEHYFGIKPPLRPENYLKPKQFHRLIDPLLAKYSGVWMVMQTSQHRLIYEMVEKLTEDYKITLHQNRDWLNLAEIRPKNSFTDTTSARSSQ